MQLEARKWIKKNTDEYLLKCLKEIFATASIAKVNWIET